MWLYLTGLNQSPTAKLTPIVKQCYSLEWPMEIYQRRLSGTTYEPFQERIYVSLSTLLSAGSRNHARTLALQEMEKAWQESEADCFMRSLGCVARLSQDLSFWKMSRQSLLEVEPKWLEKLPKWGMTVGGALYPLRPLERCTEEKGGSYWPTPTTQEITHPNMKIRNGRRVAKNGNTHSIGLADSVQMWPTPTARDATRNKGGSPSDCRRNTPNLPTAILKIIATPTASQANKPIREPSPSRQNRTHGEDLQDSIGRLNPENIGKRLCPRWVSVLMGYPTWWTDCEAWAMQSSPNKSNKRLKS